MILLVSYIVNDIKKVSKDFHFMYQASVHKTTQFLSLLCEQKRKKIHKIDDV